MSFRGYSIRSTPSLATCVSSSCGKKRSVPDTSDVSRAFIQHALAIFFILLYVSKHFFFLFQAFFPPTSYSLLSQEPYISAVKILSSSEHLKKFSLFTLLRNRFVTPDICRRILYVQKLPQ